MMLFRKKSMLLTAASTPPLRGVNLGGWLVLEKWITPSLFEGLSVTDEYTLCSLANPGIRSMIARHRDSFITKSDFQWLARHGVEAIRLPVGYWLFGDEPPYFEAVSYVDKAFAWAKQTRLKILLDLHGVPGSQNGFDHSGQAGGVGWHKDEANIVKTLSVIGKLADRYGKHPSLLGISLLNEPKWTMPVRPQLRYYTAAYKLIRERCGPDAWVVFSDNFRPRRWKRLLQTDQYHNLYIDTHQYQCFGRQDRRLDAAGHLRKTISKLPRKLAAIRRYHPMIVGEWSLALAAESEQGLADHQLGIVRQAYAASQLIAYDAAAAWFFWTYKTEDGGPWSLRDSVERGWLRLARQ